MTRLRKCTGRFVVTKIDDETVLMHLENGEFFSLKDTASLIWDALDDGPSRADLLARIATEFALPVSEITRDTDDFLAELENAGLIENV